VKDKVFTFHEILSNIRALKVEPIGGEVFDEIGDDEAQLGHLRAWAPNVYFVHTWSVRV
jgi:hypothetical protein